MKKIFAFLLAALLLLAITALPALAEGEAAPAEAATVSAEIAPTEAEAVEVIAEEPVPTPGELPTRFTWKYLYTTGGAAIFVFFLVQFAKAPLDKVGHIPTRLLVYILALATLLVANAFLNHGLNIETAVLCVFNALISAYSAYGMYEVWVRKKDAAA